jgi:biotin synthase
METNYQKIQQLSQKAYSGAALDKSEIIELFSCPDEYSQLIFDAADKLRKEEVGDEVHLRGLIEFSNYCKRNCEYCGLRRDNKNLLRYRLEIAEIIETAKNAESLGYRSVVMQSGEDPYYTAERIARIVDGIKKCTDLAVTLSCGEFSFNEYKLMKDSGADRYLLRFETSDKALYKTLHPDSDFDERIQCLHFLKELDYQLGSGFMVGLPGETIETLADNLLLLKEFDFDMVGIGPFIPNPDTNLANQKGGLLSQALLAVALTRLTLRNAHIPATTAMGSLDPKGREKALNAGANVVMPNVSPMKFRELYALYPNKICITDDPGHCRNCITGKIHGLGRSVAKGHGHSLKKNR